MSFLSSFLRRKPAMALDGALPVSEAGAQYGRYQDIQQQTWQEWIAAPLRQTRPWMWIAILSLLANAWQFQRYSTLAQQATSVAPLVVVVDPTKTKVLQTIALDPASFTVDAEAEHRVISDEIDDIFSITTDAHRGRQQKERARFRTLDNTPAVTKVDGWFAVPANDPITAGAEGTIDVTDVKITPALGDHRWTIEWTMQPYSLTGEKGVSYVMKGEAALQVLVPKTQDQANKWYPYVFFKDLKWERE